MSTMSMLHALRYELKSNEKDALLEILNRFSNGGNTIYATHAYIQQIENRHEVSIDEIQTKLSEGVPHYKVSTKRIGKDLDLL